MTNVTPLLRLHPEATIRIIEACDSAWHALRGSIFASGDRAQETREVLIRRIVEIAESGECDLIRLRDGALQQSGMAG
jgi:hypothetical protein